MSTAPLPSAMYAFLLLEMRKTGIALCAFSSLWFIGASQVWLPYALKMAGTSLHYRFQRYIDIMGHWDKKSFYLFRIVAYSWFLPFLGKKAFLSLLCTAPFLGIVVVSNYPTIWGMNGQYEDLLAIFLLISFCYAIIWLQYNLPQRWQKQILTAGTASIVIVMEGTTTLRNVANGGTPRLMEASSTDTSIWCSRAEVVLTENGVLRIK